MTQKQKSLIKEIEEINSMLSLDYQNILNYDKDGRTYYLQAAKDKIIRGQIIA